MSHYISAKTLGVTDTRQKVAKIVLFLKNNRGPHSVHNIRARTRIDLQKADNLSVKNALQQNKKVIVLGSTFEYRPFISGIKGKTDLRTYIETKPQGVALKHLEDAYISAKSDLAEWHKTGRIVQFMNNDTKDIQCFWYFGRLRQHPLELQREKDKQLKNKDNETEGGEEEKKITMDIPEEINDGMVDKQLFPLIGDSIIATWNDIKIPPTKEELQRQLEEVNLISNGFTKKRTRKTAAIVSGRQKKRRKVNLISNGFTKKRTRKTAAIVSGRQKKRRKLSLNRMNLTNIHMLQDSDLKDKMLKNSDDRERELPTLPPPK